MKKMMLICAPITSRSGYGEHARDLVRSYMEHDKYEIHIQDVRWGDCPRNALDKKNPTDKQMLDLILKEPSLPRQPDIYVDIRIPNEFQTIGKYNIGITAGTETNAVSQEWLQGCNKMDLCIVPSNHSKAGFVNSLYDEIQQAPNGQQQKVGELKLEKPMEVLFEGADEDVYKPLDTKEIDSEFFDWLNTEVPEKFAFLLVGQWTKGNYGEDRKDIGKTIKVFYETFANKKKQPALILKTNGATYSIMDREEMKSKIQWCKSQFPSDWKFPNVYLLHGDLSKEEMNYLYNHPKVKSMVSFTHGEGFGRPLLEASMTGLPVIAPNWSGQIDFLDPKYTALLSGKLEQIPQSAVWKGILIEGSKWFVVDEKNASNALNFVKDDIMNQKRQAKELMGINRDKFTLKKMTEKLDDIMSKHMSDIPEQVNVNLPKLKKLKPTGKPQTIPDIKLPKLKKLTETT
tara:strand:- start:1511 stop:2884 length:1374 start_codon:yes stop_codon:yes gene_type:complete